MKAQQIVSVKKFNGQCIYDCACGSTSDLFVVEYEDEYGDLTGNYPSLLQCQMCVSNARADAEWFSHH